MNNVVKIVFVSFVLMFLVFSCGGSKEEIQTYTVGGSCHPKIDMKLREPIIIVDFVSLTEDTTSYEPAQIIGGYKSLQSKIEFPEIAIKKGIEGKVYIVANLDSIGNIVELKLLKGIGGGCDEAAIEGIKKQGFIPSKRKGLTIKDTFRIGVIFKLQ